MMTEFSFLNFYEVNVWGWVVG